MALRVSTVPADEQELSFDVGGAPVRLRVRPVATVFVEQAEWAGRLAVQAAEKGGDGRLDQAERTGCYLAAYVAQLGKSVIVGWDVVDGNGAPVPCAPETVATVLTLNPDLAKAFDREYAALLAERRAEGNGSAPAPSGTSASGANTAAPAEPGPTTGTATAAPT